MKAWFEFYTVIGAASATLMGLLFVAVSMNARSALGAGHKASRRLAEQAFQNYLAVLMVSLIALYPDMSLPTFAATTLTVIAVWSVLVLVRLYLALTQPAETRLRALRRHLSALIGFTILVYSVVRMALKLSDERNTFASGTIVLLFSATETAWVLLNQIARGDQSV